MPCKGWVLQGWRGQGLELKMVPAKSRRLNSLQSRSRSWLALCMKPLFSWARRDR